ncbi:MAG: FAD-dependent oxidoreductase [Nitrososphaeria archaeon]
MEDVKFIVEPQRETAVIMDVDVAVAGGGPAGFVSAIAAARNGAKTVLIERFNFLGGMAATGLPFLTFHNLLHEQIIKGIPQELVDRLVEIGASPGHIFCPHHVSFTTFDPEMLKYVALQMAEEAGVKLLFHTFVACPIIKDNVVKGLIVENKSGRQAILAKVVIDATGDADLAVAAGAPYEKREVSILQPGTLMFRMGNVDVDKIREYIVKHPESLPTETEWEKQRIWEPKYFQENKKFILVGLRNLVKEAREKGDYKSLQDFVILITLPREGEVAINMAKVIFDGSNALSLSNAELEGRKSVMDVANFLKTYVPGFENSYLVDTAHHIGVRETRRIVGDYMLTKEDVMNDKKFDDGIAMCGYFMDVHAPGGRQQHFRGGAIKGFDIPYRCLVPRNVENLLVAGRTISSTFEAQGAIRIMATCMAVGQAAGTAAALAAKEGITPRQLNIQRLRKTLKEQGAYF